jgi:hypothetical protein
MSNLDVKITADVADLQVKFATAKAEVNGLSAEMRKLAQQSAQGVLDPAGQAQLQQVAEDFLKAKAKPPNFLRKCVTCMNRLGASGRRWPISGRRCLPHSSSPE